MGVFVTIILAWSLLIPCFGIPKIFGAENPKNCSASHSRRVCNPVKNCESKWLLSYPVFIRQSWSFGGCGEYVNLTFTTFDKLGDPSIHTLISRVRFQRYEMSKISKQLYDKCFFEVTAQQAVLLFLGQVFLELNIQWVAYGKE
jgi:hypothetical protein